MLDEQPLRSFAARTPGLHVHQSEVALQLLSIETKFEVAFAHHLRYIALRFPRTHVPHHHRTSAVVSIRDGTFEVEVRNWMVLYLHGEALVSGIERGSFGDGP